LKLQVFKRRKKNEVCHRQQKNEASDVWKQEKARQGWFGAGARAWAKVHRAVRHLAEKRSSSQRKVKKKRLGRDPRENPCGGRCSEVCEFKVRS
jgi:hypothetical protein